MKYENKKYYPITIKLVSRFKRCYVYQKFIFSYLWIIFKQNLCERMEEYINKIHFLHLLSIGRKRISLNKNLRFFRNFLLKKSHEKWIYYLFVCFDIWIFEKSSVIQKEPFKPSIEMAFGFWWIKKDDSGHPKSFL